MKQIIQSEKYKFNSNISKEEAIKIVTETEIVMNDKRRKSNNYCIHNIIAGVDGDDIIHDVFTVIGLGLCEGWELELQMLKICRKVQ